jgi:hypothetical protein
MNLSVLSVCHTGLSFQSVIARAHFGSHGLLDVVGAKATWPIIGFFPTIF